MFSYIYPDTSNMSSANTKNSVARTNIPYFNISEVICIANLSINTK
jgi:hypothetical protein